MDDPSAEQPEQPHPPSRDAAIGRDQVHVEHSPGAVTGTVGTLNQNYGTQNIHNYFGDTARVRRTVFLCSTAQDLVAYRQIADDTILRLPRDAVALERAVPPPGTPVAECERMAAA